jgi:site-specific DNA recombinase
MIAMIAAIYSRKSVFTGKGESIENQVQMCREYAKAIGIEEFEIYEDEGFSGGNIERPEFQRLMNDIKKKKISHLICYRLDRISRNVADFSNSLVILNKYNVSFISIKEQFDTSSAMGRAMMNISAVFAQLERETIAERIKDNLRELAKTGRWLGGPPPLGYKSVEVKYTEDGKVKKKHKLEINHTEIEIPKAIFELFMEHKSFQRVSRILDSRGVRTRKGSLFSREIVKQAINNPVYCIADNNILEYLKNHAAETYGYKDINSINGVMAYNRRKDNGSFAPMDDWIVSVGEHPGIVDSSTWIKCQDISLQIKEQASNRNGTSQEALLSGLVVCAHCGSGMAPRINAKDKRYIYRYYTCNLRNKSAKHCQNDALNAYAAEEYVIKALKSLTREQMIENYEAIKNKKVVQIDNKNLIKGYTKKIEDNKKSISNLVINMSKISGDETLLNPIIEQMKQLSDENKKLNQTIKEVEQKNETITDTETSLDDLLNMLDNFKKFYDFTDNFEDKKRLIRSLIKFVKWDSKAKKLDVVLIGSDKERFSQALPLGDSNRRTSTCGNDCYNDLSVNQRCNGGRIKSRRSRRTFHGT